MATAELQLSINGSDHETKILAIKDLKLNGTTQPRENISNDLIAEYAEDMLRGAKFPPIIVYFDGSHYWPCDGFHRIKAALRARLQVIEAIVRFGTKRDAILASFSANSDHGFRRSNAGKRRAVTRMLEDDKWTRLADSEIARSCSVSQGTVTALREKLGIVGPAIRTITRNGKQQLMNTSNLGKNRGEKKPPVLETPDFAAAAVAEPQPTLPTMFDAFLKKVRARGLEPKTHVECEFGAIDIVTSDAVYIIAGAMTARVFRDAFVTLLFQKRKKNDEKRAVIVGNANPEVSAWIREAKKFGVDFLEFKV